MSKAQNSPSPGGFEQVLTVSKENAERLGKLLVNLRKSYGLNQEQVSDITKRLGPVNVSRTYVSELESGGANVVGISVAVMYSLARALKYPVLKLEQTAGFRELTREEMLTLGMTEEEIEKSSPVERNFIFPTNLEEEDMDELQDYAHFLSERRAKRAARPENSANNVAVRTAARARAEEARTSKPTPVPGNISRSREQTPSSSK